MLKVLTSWLRCKQNVASINLINAKVAAALCQHIFCVDWVRMDKSVTVIGQILVQVLTAFGDTLKLFNLFLDPYSSYMLHFMYLVLT